ncbi:MAG: D-alanine--D-alanine ligase [Candidatus Doudnabacteria bacterium]|nr:D-alanine--D-alanine ligase [Candidatus Doudnabacteria bacterium]
MTRKKKIRVAVIFGGKSAEHEVSLQSAKNVIEALDKDKYEPVLIGIGKDGRWFLNQRSQFLLHADNPKLVKLNKENKTVALVSEGRTTDLVAIESGEKRGIDVVFPVLHGPFGEDGTIQGMLKLMDIPFVGPSVLGSAIGMDKDVMKRLLKAADIPTPKFLVFDSPKTADFKQVKAILGLPVFVKPANLGSSVGVSKAKDRVQFLKAIKQAFAFDRKIIVEQFIEGREIECAVLGNEKPRASIPGEVIPHHEFYSYDAKYIDEHGAVLEIPAKLPKKLVKEVQDLAVRTFKVLCLEGMARVDFFLSKRGKLFVNEANTIPGFTKISMYPKLWEASGISYPDLIDRLIQLALERHRKEKNLKTNYEL